MSERKSLLQTVRDLPRLLAERRKREGVCLRCNGMGGIYGGTNGGRVFVGCPDCKGSGRAR